MNKDLLYERIWGSLLAAPAIATILAILVEMVREEGIGTILVYSLVAAIFPPVLLVLIPIAIVAALAVLLGATWGAASSLLSMGFETATGKTWLRPLIYASPFLSALAALSALAWWFAEVDHNGEIQEALGPTGLIVLVVLGGLGGLGALLDS